MTAEWVDAVWEESIVRNIVSTDKKFDKYRCPPFYKLEITTSGLEVPDREKISTLVMENGKIYNFITLFYTFIYLLFIYFFFLRWQVHSSDEEGRNKHINPIKTFGSKIYLCSTVGSDVFKTILDI